MWWPRRPQRLFQHPFCHEGPDVYWDGELGDLQAAGCHPAHGQPALWGYDELFLFYYWLAGLIQPLHWIYWKIKPHSKFRAHTEVSFFFPSARTYDNLDACLVVRSPDLVTAASLMEVCISCRRYLCLKNLRIFSCQQQHGCRLILRGQLQNII